MGKNSVGPEGARQLAVGLSSEGCQLMILDLAACKIRAEGAGHLAQALTINTSLSSLFLERNGIGDRGVKPIVDSLVKNRSLQVLGLQSNSIGLSGCRLLTGVLRDHNFVIQDLRVGGNDEHESTLEALEGLAAMQRSAATHGPASSVRRRAAMGTGPMVGDMQTLVFPSSHYTPPQGAPSGVGLGGMGGLDEREERATFSFGGAASSSQRPSSAAADTSSPPPPSSAVGGLSRRITGGSSNGGASGSGSGGLPGARAGAGAGGKVAAGVKGGWLGEQEEDFDQLLSKYRT